MRELNWIILATCVSPPGINVLLGHVRWPPLAIIAQDRGQGPPQMRPKTIAAEAVCRMLATTPTDKDYIFRDFILIALLIDQVIDLVLMRSPAINDMADSQ